MHPVLFKVFGFPVSSYGILVALAFLAGFWYLRLHREGAGLSQNQVKDLFFGIVLGAILGSKLLYLAVNWGFVAGEWRSGFSEFRGGWESYGSALEGALGFSIFSLRVLLGFRYGFAFYGGLAGAVLASLLFARKNKLNFSQKNYFVSQ